MAKIILLFKFDKKTPLTPLMIKTLREACKKQDKKMPIGQVDLSGAFVALVKRGLIDAERVQVNSGMQTTWFVTNKGIQTLKNLGSSEPLQTCEKNESNLPMKL